jgi:hypothetical protein
MKRLRSQTVAMMLIPVLRVHAVVLAQDFKKQVI